VITPSVPNRSIVNGVIYSDPAELRDALGKLADAYREAGVIAWMVWVPEGDEEAASALADAGHVLDGRPAAMAMELADLQAPELGDLDWDAEAGGAEVGALNDLAYGWSEAGTGHGLRDLKGGPTTHLYRARVDGSTASVAAILDTADEATLALVATDPDHRGRGLSTRLIAAALGEAVEREMRTSTLQATEAGVPIYEGLGYRSFGNLQMWERRES
jgi:GNAT superfamily N-acetyltransferase